MLFHARASEDCALTTLSNIHAVLQSFIDTSQIPILVLTDGEITQHNEAANAFFDRGLIGAPLDTIEFNKDGWISSAIDACAKPGDERSIHISVNEDTRQATRSAYVTVVAWQLPIDAAPDGLLHVIRFYVGRSALISPPAQNIDDAGYLDLIDLKLTRRDELERATALFQSVFESAASGVALVGLDGSWLKVNRRLCELLQYTETELRALTFQDITHPDDLAADLALVNSLLLGERDHYAMDKRYFKRDGSLMWATLTVGLQRDGNGDPMHFVSSIVDISNSKQLEQSERQQRKRLEATLGNAAVGVVLTSRDGIFLEVNPKMASMLGYSQAELVGRSYRDFTDPEDLPLNAGSRADLWNGVVKSVSAEKRWVRRDGSRIWTRMTVSIQQDLPDTPPYSIGIAQDIEDEKRLEATQTLLTAELSHRVKNTLSLVQGMVGRTLQLGGEPDVLGQKIEQRLQSISKAHDLLSASDWRHLDLEGLVQVSLVDTFKAHESAFDLAITPITLSAQQAITLALIIHELSTNSVKYGALSTGHGRIALTGRLLEGEIPGHRQVEITWIERGGPPAVDTGNAGFGSFLLKRGVSHGLRGTSTYDLTPAGLDVAISFSAAESTTLFGQRSAAYRAAKAEEVGLTSGVLAAIWVASTCPRSL